MSKAVVAYFASKEAAGLWSVLSAFFCICLLSQIIFANDKPSVVQLILFVADLFHFWLPIVACRYLYNISK